MGGHQGGQDKRTLVLFLFGLALMAAALGQPAPLPPLPGYIIAQAAGDSPWQVIALPGGQGAGPDVKGKLLSAYPHSFELAENTTLPPELALFFHRPLAINACSQETLRMLPGVGPRLAEAIVRTRLQAGPFAGPDDLLKVPGIGANNRQRILPLIRFD